MTKKTDSMQLVKADEPGELMELDESIVPEDITPEFIRWKIDKTTTSTAANCHTTAELSAR